MVDMDATAPMPSSRADLPADPPTGRRWRQSWLSVDLDAITDNVRALAELVAPSALCAVVKADGYGHGAVPAAVAARAGGASWFGVALVEEGIELRHAGITEPVLVLSEQQPSATAAALDADLTVTVASAGIIDAAARWARATGRIARVHLKVNTGMNRMGAEMADGPGLARSIASTGGLELAGTWTHLACADDPSSPVTAAQLSAFEELLATLRADGIDPGLVHAANSAGAIRLASSRFGLVRCGIAIYGIAPSMTMSGAVDQLGLRPALTLHTRITAVRRVPAGTGISYGHAGRTTTPCTIATVPVGYADGLPRRSGLTGGVALVRTQRRPLIGVVTMDQTMIDCGDLDVDVGEPVVLLGAQGDERITANEMGEQLSTIGYEIVCGLAGRLHRSYSGDPT